MSRLRLVPGPLWALLAVSAVLAFAWACALPFLQGQDEISHSAYPERIVVKRSITWDTLTGVRAELQGKQPPYSTETYDNVNYTSVGSLAGNAGMKPYRERIDEDRWRAHEAGLPDDANENVGYASSMRNPPLYYLYEAPVYAAFANATMLDRGFAMRVVTIPWLLLTVVATWLLAGEVLRRQWLQVVAAGAVALQPLLAQLGGVLNPDPALAAFSALALWLCAVVVNRGPSRGRVGALLGVTALTLLTHGRGAAIVAPVAVALGLAWWRSSGPHSASRARLALLGVGGLGALVVAASVWVALRGEISVARVREFASYLWQFYLPSLGSMEPPPVPEWDARDVFVDRFFSGFAQLEVNLAPRVLDALAWASVAGVIVLGAALWVRRDAVRRHLGLLAVFVVAFVALLASLHVAAWRELQVDDDPVITGRYLFALVPLFGLAIATVASALPRRIGPVFGITVLLVGVALNLSALGTAVVRFGV